MISWIFKMLGKLFGDMPLVKRIMNDIFTTAAGDYDGAKIFGYGFLVIAATLWLSLFTWITIKTVSFNSVDFVAGVVTLSGLLISTSWSVRIKNPTEPQPGQEPFPSVPPSPPPSQ